PRSRAPMIAVALLVLGGLGAGGYYVYTTTQKQDEPKVATGPGDDKPVVTPPAADAGAATPAAADAAVVANVTADASTAAVAVVTPDAAAAAPVDAGVVAEAGDASVDRAPDVLPTAKSHKLKITSKPKGARVFIDGADQGTTPLTLPGSTDRHTMVVLLPGHDLFVGEIDGSGVFDITLEPVTPS